MLLALSAACGGVEDPNYDTYTGETYLEGEPSPDSSSEAATSEDRASEEEPSGEINPEVLEICECTSSDRWEFKDEVTAGNIVQGTPVLQGSPSFTGNRTFRAKITNDTTSPSTTKITGSECTTTSGSVTLQSSSSATLNAGISIGGFTVGGSGTVATTSGHTMSIQTCRTVGADTPYTTQPGETLYCTDFDGLITRDYLIPRHRNDKTQRYRRRVYKCRRDIIHICSGVIYGPWKKYGQAYGLRVDLDPINLTLVEPIGGTRCSINAYPLTPM